VQPPLAAVNVLVLPQRGRPSGAGVVPTSGRSDLMFSKPRVLATLAAVVVATGVVVLPATGHDVKPSGTLVFSGKGSSPDQATVDVRPKGISLGDHFPGSETLRQAGALAGRMEADCVVIDRRLQGQACS
jgi:hypothetical protein